MIVKIIKVTDLLGKPRKDTQHKTMINSIYRACWQPFMKEDSTFGHVILLERLKDAHGRPAYRLTQTSEVKGTYEIDATTFCLTTLNSTYTFQRLDEADEPNPMWLAPSNNNHALAPWHSFPATKEDKECSQNSTATQTKGVTLT